MDFNDYLKEVLENDPELKEEYDALQPEYEIISSLITARTEYGITQKELAKRCGVRQSNISRLESGKGNPTLKFLKRLADALDCDLSIELRKREPATESLLEAKSAVEIVTCPAASDFKEERSESSKTTYIHVENRSLRIASVAALF